MKRRDTPVNIVLADCPPEEIATFVEGLTETLGEPVEILSSYERPYTKRSMREKLRYYGAFFGFPLKAWLHRGSYRYVIGWQQFYALNFAFYSLLSGSKGPDNRVVAVNYTYKRKPGWIGKIYHRYMKWCVSPDVLDSLHIPSYEYSRRLEGELGVDPRNMMVTPFGTPDLSDDWSRLPRPVEYPYILAIGRSNRDFDYLAKIWSRPELKDYRLIVLSDLWSPARPLPHNVVHLTDVIGEASYPYFAHALMSIVPVDDPVICSGDTVLLNSMMMSVPVVVTAPSTLAEMYVTDGADGIHIGREPEKAAEKIARVLGDEDFRLKLGKAARHTYETNFSRLAMGRAIGSLLRRRASGD